MNKEDQKSWDEYQKRLHLYFSTPRPEFHEDWSSPFAPWCGADYWESRTRILIVGKSVGASSEAIHHHWRLPLVAWQNKPIPALETTTQYVSQQLRELKPVSHAFWTIPFLVAGAILPPSTSESRLLDCIAWTNLYKVNRIEEAFNKKRGRSEISYKVPKTELCKELETDCNCLDCTSTRWLVEEIGMLKPHVILMGLGRRWRNAAHCLRLPESLTFPSPLTQQLRRKIPQNTNLKSAWLTYHFSQWRQACEHGVVVLRIRRELEEGDLASFASAV